MPRILSSLLLLCFLLYCFAQDKLNADRPGERNSFQKAEALFQKAESLYNNEGGNETLQEMADAKYKDALTEFEKLIAVTKDSGFDSLNLFANLRAGLICYYLDKPQDARNFYLDAFRVKPKLPAITDSILFIPYIYTGGIYHNTDQYDSALHFYNLAAGIQEKYADPLPESERLFNRLGVILYEKGNFRQARNYFEKAIELTDRSNLNLLTNYRINIASILVKLEEYREAREIYESALPSGLYPDEINHNLGIVYLRLNNPAEAIHHLRLCTYPDNRKSLDLFYNFSMAFAMLGEADSSEFYFQRAIAENVKWNGKRKNIAYGLLLKFRGDQLSTAEQFEEATRSYQQAINQFHSGFSSDDVRSNPEEFGEAFSFINLFQALTAKARAFDGLYSQSNSTDDLVSALDSYESAFRLAHFIERTYDSDEARLFLNRIKHSEHGRPIDVCIRLHQLTGEKKYLENAYLFDQRNKASVLSLSILENELRTQASDPLLQKEAELRSLVTRLSLEAASSSDTAALGVISSKIRNAEIELGKIQDEVRELPEYRGRFLTENIPSVKEIQNKLDNKTALISWHLSDKDLLALIIRGDKFTYKLTPVDSLFIPQLDSFRYQLQVNDPSGRYAGRGLSQPLYELLVRPLLSEIRNVDRLIIIPDDELSYIPFEALQDANQNYFLEKYSILYQFSTHFIDKPARKKDQPGILAFAPFAQRGFSDSTGEIFSVLPASLEEVKALNGKILVDSIGTKQNFLNSANSYGTLHLATHAAVNNATPGLSYIAFFPAGGDYKLYAREIYDMRLDSTDLVILSACETGMGKLIKGEGLMSLTRAFAFAGCPNIIMSLWKAEDKTTSYITKRLHYYLEKDFSKDEALRRAKKDLLSDNSLDPRFKTPNHWAHLLFIGEYEKRKGSNNRGWLVGALIISAILYLVHKNYFRKP